MKARMYEEEDYEQVCEWWDDHNMERLNRNLLSDTGIIIHHNGYNICAAWLYKTNSSFIILAWFVSDKYTVKKKREEALNMLIKESEVLGKRLGYKIITAFSNIDKMVKRLEKHDYIKGDEGMINLIKGL